MGRLLILATTLLLLACTESEPPPAAQTAAAAPGGRLLLVSIDGYRHDYTALFQPPFLSQFRAQGASLSSLRPAFPSKTFPNHLTLVTGMLPAHHGIVFNSFYAPDLRAPYSLKNRQSVRNAAFYLAEPLWVWLERAGIKTATYFWPGSEAAIGGIQPTQVMAYQHATPHSERIETVLAWIAQRGPHAPRFMSLYFSQVDSAGHTYGPTAPETRTAVLDLDRQLADLWQRAQRADPGLNMVIVSDHGMQGRVDGQVTPLFSADNQHLAHYYRAVGDGPSVQLYLKRAGQSDPVQDSVLLNRDAAHFSCHTGQSAPAHWGMADTQRMGDILCVADNTWNLAVTEGATFSAGDHGWPTDESIDAAAKDLHAIFYAQGPAFKSAVELPTRDNIHVLPLLAAALGIEPPAHLDGRLAAMAPLLAGD